MILQLTMVYNMKSLNPYKRSKHKRLLRPYKTWSREDLAKSLRRQVLYYRLPEWVITLLEEAIKDEDWNPITQYDGCTVVQDPDHPCIACFIHDYHWITGRGGWLSNVIFAKVLKLTNVNKYQRVKNFIGVNIGWFFYYKWVHLSKANVKGLTAGMIKFKSLD